MSTSFLSPGVYVREIDFSLYVPNLSTTALGCVGYATKGPINSPQYISNPVEFSSTFGDPSPDMTGPYAALQFLAMGRQLWYVRVAEPNEYPVTDNVNNPNGYVYASRPATVTLKEAVTKASVVGSKSNIVTLTGSNNVLTFSVDGTNTPLTVTFSYTSPYKSMSDFVVLLNSDTNFQTYFVASLSAAGTLTITRNQAGSNHGFVVSGSGLADILGFSSAQTAWGTGNLAEGAYVMHNLVFSTITVDAAVKNTLRFSLDGANLDVTFINGTYTPTQVVNFLNSDSGFKVDLVASVVSGGVFVSIKPTSAKTHLMLATATVAGGVTGDLGPVIFGNINAAKYIHAQGVTTLAYTSANNVLSFSLVDITVPPAAEALGTYSVTIPVATYATIGDLVTALNTAFDTATHTSVTPNTIVDVSSKLVATADSTSILLTFTSATEEYIVFDKNSSAFNSLFGNQPQQKYVSTVSNDVLTVTATSDGTWGNNISVNVQNVNVVNGTFDLLVYERGYIQERFEGLNKTTASANFVETRVNGVSTRIVVANGTLSGAVLLPSQNALNTNTYLAGGNSGTSSTINPSTFIGVVDANNSTGLQLFRNPEQLDINLIMTPGIWAVPVINAMIDVCTYRHDCMALVDPPYGYRPQDVVDWVNGASGDHAALNSSYGATYWPWAQIYDPVNSQTVWTAPSGHVSYVYAYTDYNAETWSAPAGINRGHLSTPIKMEYIPTLGERDLLYQNNINPIATFIRDGINIWGQKTLQRNPTALDRVSVRRLMLYLEKVVATAVRTLNFEPADKYTWIQLINLVEPFLESVKARRGVTEYKIVCDETTNTPDVIDRNEMHARIYIRPTKTAEFIAIDFVITDAGTAFSELVF